MKTVDFPEWLESELQARGWKPADLASAADISQGTLSNILNRLRQAGPDVCVAIAGALNVPAAEVFRRAGLLPAEREEVEGEGELMHVYRGLSPGDRAAALRMVRGLSGRRGGVSAAQSGVMERLDLVFDSASIEQMEWLIGHLSGIMEQYRRQRLVAEKRGDYDADESSKEE